MKKTVISAALALTLASFAAQARDHINIVGSSTVYPFATVVAEKFGKSTKFKTPVIESTGSGGGLKLFCKGAGENTPDISNASRRIKQSEIDTCKANGVTAITEVLIGYDGIAIANSKQAPQYSLSLRDLYMALAKEIPARDGSEKLVPNYNQTWQQVNSKLPATKIEVIGPPPSSGTRDAFAELAIEGGCKTFPWLKAMKKTDKSHYKKVCRSLREDGAYIEAGENDNLIVQKLEANADALGVFGFSFLDQNKDKVQGSKIEGKAPDFESIADGSYIISRPLFFYVKNAHVDKIPGMREYVQAFVSKKATGTRGYLADKGLIPLDAALHQKMAAQALQFKPVTLKK